MVWVQDAGLVGDFSLDEYDADDDDNDGAGDGDDDDVNGQPDSSCLPT